MEGSKPQMAPVPHEWYDSPQLPPLVAWKNLQSVLKARQCECSPCGGCGGCLQSLGWSGQAVAAEKMHGGAGGGGGGVPFPPLAPCASHASANSSTRQTAHPKDMDFALGLVGLHQGISNVQG